MIRSSAEQSPARLSLLLPGEPAKTGGPGTSIVLFITIDVPVQGHLTRRGWRAMARVVCQDLQLFPEAVALTSFDSTSRHHRRALSHGITTAMRTRMALEKHVMHTKNPGALRSRDLRVRSLHEGTRSVDVIASTEAIDSYGEIVEARWRLDRYLRNPVVLFGHNSRTLPIGKASNVRVEGGALRAMITFASEAANPEAERIWQLVRGGFLNAVSVGFVPGSVRAEKRNGNDVTILSDNELHEISVVPIPANAEALMKMRAAGITPVSVPAAVELAALAARGAGSNDDPLHAIARDAGVEIDSSPSPSSFASAAHELAHAAMRGDVTSHANDPASELAALALAMSGVTDAAPAVYAVVDFGAPSSAVERPPLTAIETSRGPIGR